MSNHIGAIKEKMRSKKKKETIPFQKVGRQNKFRVSEVDAWIESGQSADADKIATNGGK